VVVGSQPHTLLKGGDEMKLYGAIDLHSTNNVTVVINEQDHPMGVRTVWFQAFVLLYY
jgi:hypothetical protein